MKARTPPERRPGPGRRELTDLGAAVPDDVTRSRSRGVRGAQVVLGVVFAVLAVLIGWLLPTGDPDGARPTSGPNATHHGSHGVAADSSEGADGDSPREVVSWAEFAGLQLPVSPTAGPRCLGPDRAGCFTQDADGAALAAVHLMVRTFPFAGSDVFEPTIREQVIGRYQPDLARLTARAYDWALQPAAGVEDGAPVPVDDGWVAGFQTTSLPDPSDTAGAGDVRADAVVRVLIRQADHSEGAAGPAFTVTTVRLAWRDGDWQLIAPLWGDWRTAIRPATPDQLEQFTPYAEVGGAS